MKTNTQPWWRDRVWLTTLVLSGLILTSAYCYWKVRDRRAAIRALAHNYRLQGDLLLLDGRAREALGSYRQVIRLIQERGGSDPGLQAEQAEAQAKIDQITRAAEDRPVR
jgi:hypothetical protein